MLLTGEQVEVLFAGARAYRSKQVVDAERVNTSGVWSSARGSALRARVGDWELSAGDDRWIVAADAFDATYRRRADGRYVKQVSVRAVQVVEACDVTTLEGVAHAAAGDWLVRNPTGEVWPVTNDRFWQSYCPEPNDR